MRNFDFSPFYRSAIGFDRLFNTLESTQNQNNSDYPPYNIELVNENHYRIIINVTGFTESELEITYHDNILSVQGRHIKEKKEHKYLYEGITKCDFEKKFQLANHIIINSAHLEYGILSIDLKRITPEEEKPRRIEIK